MRHSVTSAEVLGIIRSNPGFSEIELPDAIACIERCGISVSQLGIEPVNIRAAGWFKSDAETWEACSLALAKLVRERKSAKASAPAPTESAKSNTITAAHVADLIARSTFTDAKLGDKTTVVCMKLPNGYEVVESSGCVDPANYNHDMGVRICKERMVNRVWQLEGYRLQSELAVMTATEAAYLERVEKQNQALAAEAIELAAARHWDLTATIKWHDPLMREDWKRENLARMAYALTGVRS